MGTTAYKNHLKKNGHPSDSGYKEVLYDWNLIKIDLTALTKNYKAAGVRFLMIQEVHHDNYDKDIIHGCFRGLICFIGHLKSFNL